MISEGQIAYSVLMLIGSAGPVSMYFLSLGLVNCHARPCLISARSDFIALSVVLAPLLLWSLPVAIQFGSGWMLGLAVILLAVIFRKLVPRADEGFVLYNLSRRIGCNLIHAALACQDTPFDRESESEWVSRGGRVRITATAFALLRSVSIQIEGESPDVTLLASRFRECLEHKLSRIEQLPSAIGAGLVLAGVGIAVVPMWLVTRHIQDLVEAVASFFG